MDINSIIRIPEITRKIFSHLTPSDLSQCALVSRTWFHATRDARSKIILRLTPETLKKPTNGKKIEDHIREEKSDALQIIIHGWSKKDGHIPNTFYDNLFNSELRALKLVLKGRGVWDTCRCPNNLNGVIGSQMVDNVSSYEKTRLSCLVIGETFTISSCALLDLLSRSPNLKILQFGGIISKHDHNQAFQSKVFYCDLQQIYWPFPNKKQIPTISTIAKRNDSINTLHSSIETVCDLLASETLEKLKYLSMNLTEKWSCTKGNHKKIYKYLEKIKYLPLAKELEALEIRTFDLDEICEDEETSVNVERVYENYKLSFWEQVSKLPKLKYLAIFGAWQLESVCSELAKHGAQIEYLKTNLIPSSVIEAIDGGDDNPVLRMVDAVRNMRKLTSLRSVYYSCADKLANIGNRTTGVLKELLDIIWVFDIKVKLTPEVEEFVANVARRGNQLGRQYEVELLVSPGRDSEYADLLVRQLLKVPYNFSLRQYLETTASRAVKERYGHNDFGNIYIWGIRQVDNIRDKANFDRMKSAWRRYEGKFNPQAVSR